MPLLFAPYILELPQMKTGENEIAVTLFGHRGNGFGAVHNANPEYEWYGPDSYRTEKEEWCYEYRLKPLGILSSPVFLDG